TKTLWEQGQTELVVSVIKSQDQCVTLRHSEFMTLRPEELICGEVIEAYMRATLNQCDPAHRIFQIDHYTNGVILGGSREQMSRHLMRNVNLDTFDAAVSFVNVNNNHWRFLYLHVPSRSLFVMDPAAAEQDLHLSTTAVQCYNRYFQMRQNLYGKQVWGSLKWKAATIPHTVQQDTTSCGVFVMQMAKEAIQSFPAIPSFNMKNSPRDMCRLREEMAEELLSTSEKDYCSMCGLKEVPRDKDIEAVVIDWVGA
ncbi:Ubiquitin-like-specific protease 1, partial [Dissostichus eleginoides]